MTKGIKLSLKPNRCKQIVVSVDTTLDSKLAKLAEEQQMSVSTVAYQILDQAIDFVEA